MSDDQLLREREDSWHSFTKLLIQASVVVAIIVLVVVLIIAT